MDSANGNFSGRASGAGVGGVGGGAGGAIVSGGSGDVVLPAGGEKKSKGPLIAVVALVVLAVCVIVGLVMGRGKEESGASTSSGYVTDFNIYANYYLYGEDQNTPINVSDSVEGSYFDRLVDTGNLSQAYLNRMKELFDKFESSYSGASTDDGYSLQLSNDYGTYFTFIHNYYSGDTLTRSAIVKISSEDGDDSVRSFIAEALSRYDGTDNELVSRYYTYATDWANGTVDLANIWMRVGCVVDGEVDYECAASVNDADAQRLTEEISERYMVMSGIVGDVRSELYHNTFTLGGIVYGEENSENE